MIFCLHETNWFYVFFTEFCFVYAVSGNLPVYLNLTDECFGIIDNAELKIYGHRAIVECQEGYDLEGSSDISCLNGRWRPKPRCVPRCLVPPPIRNGTVTTNEQKDYQGLYPKGTVATYSCSEGFYLIPSESKLRVCEEGIWTGSDAKCFKQHNSRAGCERPQEVTNGYYVFEKHGQLDPFGVGQRLHYSCREGFILEGSPVQQCLENGDWSPKIQPICWKPMTDLNLPCGEAPFVPFSAATVVKGRKTEESADPETVIEIRCQSIFHDGFVRHIATCQPSKLTCIAGKWRWIGKKPDCGPNVGCPSPPSVNHATASLISGYRTSLGYPIKAQVSYKCLPDYILEGNGLLTCLEGGCWFPSIPPSCISDNDYTEYNALNAFLISIVTGAVVLSSLLVICLLVFYRRKRQIMRELALPPTVQGPDMGDHAILLQQPDRLALIAFAEGQRNSLPTYDEAVRDRPPNYLSSGRLPPRPQWQHITGRRSRNSPNSDLLHSGRHGSFVSHTPSTRSAGDSMGSTDTMAISENSTNVTLDTVSSHSGSQAPSCRAHCGSLASFDTSSVIITEDVPLLEESELEEVPVCDTISLMLESPSIQDNASQKISGSTAEVP
ncbi:sushi, von Willebrand factor type A, EGF and pentraxin domain-containing protein 1-like [Coccinella septempunctata]|uniref:sushi, von Willebrand factor type A, EGF and pentraxin domain-containing protein 1-like n=1 Tax=Coccinella septempunctata TaxID=41139 RepID=UPI001D07007D|nr:sushi, von Willebrand factor type A, EGF and pentraxin domain-containing protein 1-like [Coccinella septempunctata]